MSVGEIAGLIAAVAFVLLVGALAIPLLKLGRVLDQATQTLQDLTEHTMPIIDEAAETVVSARSQLDKVDVMTTATAETTQNISALTSLVAATVGAPLIKIASFSMAVRGLFSKKGN